MSDTFGKNFRVTIFGQSHSPSIGAVIAGLPAGFAPDWEKVKAFMRRRAPVSDGTSTTRRETDEFEILSGLNESDTCCGAALAVKIDNRDARPQDYDALRSLPRPGHADLPAGVRANGHNDPRGGGQYSGRLTAPLCFAGALALQLLEKRNITVRAEIVEIGGKSENFRETIQAAKAAGDSVGGIVECVIENMPVGIGEPMFDGVENRVSQAVFAIPGARGIEFGEGFNAARLRGSENNDAYFIENGRIVTRTNRHGGVLGGMTTGMPIVFRVAFKPTSSIAVTQNTVDTRTMTETTISVQGRHDPCFVPRAVPCVEAAAAIALIDLLNYE